MQITAQIQGFRGTAFEYREGLGGVSDVVAYKDGGSNAVHMQAGGTRFERITLRRPGTAGPVLWKWWKSTTSGVLKRRQVTLTLADPRGNSRAKWLLKGCWPCAWRLIRNDRADGKRDFAEEIELVVEDIELA